ncbi:hypothetical protein [Mangrovihabitans endophyticus]|uniref:Uncharacterized protein n=1 Tax=Mangrovihabitans endophyticus TaxID=1751298 RepID=A0A8J3C4L5_9ACTN|nr:hypothetical protein [Mangrovihabitans endophyticus]GGL08576.1 hypothetical protein GCM10012284_48970 [Mangrovihabitans endophyticus]
MNCRRCGSKPALGLWMLIAVADVALLAAAAGPLLVLLVVIGVAAVTAGVVGLRVMSKRATGPADVVVRRRA